MQVTDLVVEVRDGSLTRVGQVDVSFLADSLFAPTRNGVGVWQLSLPDTHPMSPILKTPKSGIVVTGPGGVLLSGPMTSVVSEQSSESPDGESTFTGVSDAVSIADALAYPSPAVVDPAAQTATNDVRTAARETLLYQYVGANIGPSAPTDRKNSRITLGTDGGRGGTGTFSPRFQNLLELLQQICAGTELWFDVRQDGDMLKFLTGAGADRTSEIRLDVHNEQLDSIESGMGAPTVTDVIVAGQGDGTARTILTRANTSSRTEWGRRIEVFKDQRQTDDLTELGQAGDDALAEGGSTVRTLKVTPSDDIAGSYGVSWMVGDMITAVIGDQEVPARVNGAAIAVKPEGVFIGVTIGDDVATDWESGVDQSISGLVSRVSNLERNTSQPDGIAFAESSGIVTMPAVAVSGTASVSVLFPVGRFTVPPRIQLTSNHSRLTVSFSGASKDGFTFNASNWTTVAVGATAPSWHAVQMTPEAADG